MWESAMPDDETPRAQRSSERISSEDFTARWSAVEGRLRRYCQRKLGNPDEADEVVQQVAFNAWSGYESLREPDRFEAWVFVLARNEISRMIGFNIRWRSHNVAMEELEIVDPKSVRVQPAMQKDEESWIQRVIDRMAEDAVLADKAANVVRHHLREEEPSWEETGRALGISANDCAATYCRAIPKVRQWILCHHPKVLGGTRALAVAMQRARQLEKEPLSDAEAEVFTARVLNGDGGYRKSGWRTALRTACGKVLHSLQLK
jgi:RNA polymerase sigma factor (sigma-70 family)